MKFEPSSSSLPQLLSESGYDTAAFISSNPNLIHYRNHFDTSWDGTGRSGFTDTGPFGEWLERGNRLLRLKSKLNASDSITRAKDWYQSRESPKFLWIHLMEPHFPYFPGLRRGADVGLFDSYKASVKYFKHKDDKRSDHFTTRELETLRQLYDKCIDYLDEQLVNVLDIVEDDATLVFTADHGEEFNHGLIGHNQLYDEVVCVPFIIESDSDFLESPDHIRQVNIVPSIAQIAGIEHPASWEGVPITEDDDRVAVLGTTNYNIGAEGRASIGVRTADRKVIRHYDIESELSTGTEVYDVIDDPTEQNNLLKENEPGPEKLQAVEEREEIVSFLSSLAQHQMGSVIWGLTAR
ncbi:sulfatase-like hydrolase/transferase [Halorubrum lacusprofundi]|nr:sulfatase-like hydrolase/transferase [Halorubrum lacusprofundi]